MSWIRNLTGGIDQTASHVKDDHGTSLIGQGGYEDCQGA